MPFPSSGPIKLSDIKDSVYKQDTTYFLDKLSTKTKENTTVAYSVRLVNSSYGGPSVNVRRSSDNATQDFYSDVNGNLGTQYLANGTSLESWLGTSVGYVTKMYDQTGNGRDISQSTAANQPTIGPYPLLDALSSAGQTAMRGAYALSRVKAAYTGPTIKFRRSADNALQDFYADSTGNLGTSLNGTGTLFKDWATGSVAYVHTWYDQSGNGFHATQTTNGSQPVYDSILGLLNFSTQSNSFLNMGTSSSGPIPTGTLNAPYTLFAKHGRVFSISNSWNIMVSGGTTATNQINGIAIYYTNNNGGAYLNYWYNNDLAFGGGFVPGNIITAKYDGTTRTLYTNNVQNASAAASGYTAPVGQQYIGRDNRGDSFFNGELHYLFIMNTAVSDTDRYILNSYELRNGQKQTLYQPFKYNISYNGVTSFMSVLQTTNSVEYPPPGTITGNNTTVSGQPYGNGTYICSSSSNNGGAGYYAFSPGVYNQSDFWESGLNYDYNSGANTGVYTTSTTNYGNLTGDWVQIQMPTSIAVKTFSIGGRDGGWPDIRSPRRFALLGSTNGSTWKCIHYESGVTDWTSADKYFVTNIDSITTYNYFRLVVIEIGNSYTGSGVSWQNVTDVGRLKFNPSMPLTRGSKAYAFFVQAKSKRGNGSATVCEQNVPTGSSIVSHYRTGFMLNGTSTWNYFYFSGQSNDVTVGTFGFDTNRSMVLVVDNDLKENTKNINFYDNGTKYSASTGVPGNLNPQTGGFYIAQKFNNTERFFGDVNEIIVVNKLVSAREVLLYNQPSDPSSFNKIVPKQKPRFHINFDNVTPNDVPIDYVVACDMKNLGNHRMDYGKIDEWGYFSQTVTANKPEFDKEGIFNGPNGGPTNDCPYVTFSSAAFNYMNSGSRTFNITSNGGFTAIMCIRMTALPVYPVNNRLFDFGNGAGTDNILIGINDSILYCMMFNGTSLVLQVNGSRPTVDKWVVVVFRYTTSNNLGELFYNGIRVGTSTASATVTNKTLANTYLAKSAWDDGIIGMFSTGLYAYARSLTYTEIAAVSNLLMYPNPQGVPRHITTRYENVKAVGRFFTHPLYSNTLYPQATYSRLPLTHAAFDGVDGQSYVEVGEFPGLPFSVSFQASVAGASTYYTLISLTERGRAAPVIQIDYDGQGGANRFVFALALPTYWSNVILVPVALNTTAHLVLTIDENYQAKVYHNGSLHTTSNGTSFKTGSSSRFIIGASGDGTSSARGYYGYLNDVRIYDYVLRSDEVSEVAASNYRNQGVISYQTSEQFLVNRYNWRSTMTFIQHGSVAGATGDSFQHEYKYLSVAATNLTLNRYYHNTAIQNYKSFVLSFDLYHEIEGGNWGDGFFVYVGGTSVGDGSSSPVDTSGATNGAYVIGFQIYNGHAKYYRGIHLTNQSFNVNGSLLAHTSDTTFMSDRKFLPVTITYTRGTVNTWVVNINGKNVITYSDQNNAAWLSTAGSYWGFGTYCGGASIGSVIRSVELSYTPYTTSAIPIYSSRLLGAGQGLSAIRNRTVPGLIPGFTWKVYNGYSNGNIEWGSIYQYRAIGRSSKTGSIAEYTNGYMDTNSSASHTIYAEGWLFADTTGTWTFTCANAGGFNYIGINGTLVAIMWQNSGVGTISLTKNTYYKINFYYGKVNTPSSSSFTYTKPGGSASSDWSNIVFSSTGASSSFPAESAKVIKAITNTNADGVYYININGTSTATYCLMNDFYDGGGWMMLMKGARWSTFNYSSTYWTTDNTLNPTETNRVDGDAKYNAFNYAPIKDVLAIFPDIPNKFATNPLNKYGGSLNIHDGWTWKVDNWNLYTSVVNQLSVTSNSTDPVNYLSNIRGAYALYKANVVYTGPTIKLRRRGDNVTQDFYANLTGKLGTTINGTGTSLETWIGGTPTKLLDSNNWSSTMTAGAVTSALAGTDPYVQSQVTNGGNAQLGYWYYGSVPISTYQNLVVDAWVYNDGSGDFYYFKFGDTTADGGQGITVRYYLWSGYSNNGFSGRGIYILKNGLAVAFASWDVSNITNTWFPLRVIYNKSTTNTWEIWYNNLSILTYSDPNALTWAASAGNYFSFGTYSGGGLRLSSWWRQINLWANFAFVDTWYDQSNNGYHATQSTTHIQPIITGDSGGKYVLDSQCQTNGTILNMGTASSMPIPTGSGNYTTLLRHGYISNTTYGGFYGSGTTDTGRGHSMRCGGGESLGYWNYWFNNDISFGANSRAAGNTIAASWDGTTHRAYLIGNGGSSMTSTSNTRTNPTAPNTASGQQYLFRDIAGNNLNGQIYHIFIANTALSTSDLSVLTNAQNFSETTYATKRSATLCTALDGFQISRNVAQYYDPFDFTGFSGTIHSYQTGAYRFIFGGGNHLSANIPVRWGFIFNNEGDFITCDTASGIGHYSSAEVYASAWAKTQAGGGGINRTMRFELFGR